jgi:hypothetical protein
MNPRRLAVKLGIFCLPKKGRVMSVYVVSYDLNKHGQNYSCLTEKLNGYPVHWHAQGSVWFIDTAQSAAEVRDHLQSCLDTNDKLIVARLSGEAAWWGYGQNVSDWLKGRLEKQYT